MRTYYIFTAGIVTTTFRIFKTPVNMVFRE